MICQMWREMGKKIVDCLERKEEPKVEIDIELELNIH